MTWNADIPDVGNSVAEDVADMEENFACLSYINVWIPAGAMLPLDTLPAAAGFYEYPTNNVQLMYYAFDGATAEFIATNIIMPENWNRSTIKAKFYWAPGHADCSAGDTVEWKMQGVSVSDDGTIDTPYTDVGEVISDTVTAGEEADLHISSATPAMTINGSPALGDLINLKISRNVGGTDDMTEDAWLFGFFIQLGVSEAVAAW